MSNSRRITMIGIAVLAIGLAMGAKLPPGVETLSIGSTAPEFRLPGTDKDMYTFDDVKGKNGTLIIFTCNHCPYAIAYQDRIIALTADYTSKGLGVAAISCNDVAAFPDDSFEAMQKRAKEKEYNFPYLYDESQQVAMAFGPLVTPHVFLFDSTKTLVYQGRIDNSAKEKEVKDRELYDAMDALIAGKKIRIAETTAFGCSIKWKPELKNSSDKKSDKT